MALYAALCVTDQQRPGFTGAGRKQDETGSFSISALCWSENKRRGGEKLMDTDGAEGGVAFRWPSLQVLPQ